MKRDRGPWLAWVLLILALVLIVLSESGALGPVEGVLSFVVAPVERAVSAIVKGVGSVAGDTRDVAELQQRVAELASANEVLVQENFRLREYQAENEELRRQLKTLSFESGESINALVVEAAAALVAARNKRRRP